MDWRRIAIASTTCLALVAGYLLSDLLSKNYPHAPTPAAAHQDPVDLELDPPWSFDGPDSVSRDVDPATFTTEQALITPNNIANTSALNVIEPALGELKANSLPIPKLEPEPNLNASQSAEQPLRPLTSLVGHSYFQYALNDLLRLWEFDFTDPETTTCELAATIGLLCYENVAGLNEMNDFNRPMVINLNRMWFTLTSIDRNRATIVYGKQTFDIRVSELLEYWNGNFTLLWLAPPGYQVPLTMGDSGPAVDWIVNRLAIIDEIKPPQSQAYIFDGTLEARVRQFQISSGLTPDGIAGVKTLIKINDRDSIHTPRLYQEAY